MPLDHGCSRGHHHEDDAGGRRPHGVAVALRIPNPTTAVRFRLRSLFWQRSPMAQSVARQAVNLQVAGSNPAGGVSASSPRE